ncbi:hypothetical protein CLV51_102806 [Chitinophaga niastensis]|uniref:Uncharacterized protein n=1 Tax=Chitinophaga niastensis TaxID=536980 RepID=A0A2P8HP05_CHINA|nr:hypothetical protein [Chitinophaga niastensis]PSL47946.1 hypothetical protein CLV51_102806 [Chitinophaga niastensis]
MNRQFFLISSIAASFLLLGSCNDKNDNEDITTTINKAGSVETMITTNHLDSTHDVLITTHKIWANYNLYKTVVHRDTVPALGIGTETGENEHGDTKEIKLQKDYEIYVTVQ